MPTYEYQCKRCGHSFERFQRMTDEPVKRCPECRGKVTRLIGAGAGIIFKGSGFYETDYKKKSTSESTGKEKDGGSSGGKPEESKSNKPASGEAGKTE